MNRDTSIYFNILNQIRTKPEADQLIEEIALLLDSLFSSKSKGEEIRKSVRKNIADAIDSSIRSDGLEWSKKQAVMDFLNGLKDEVKKLRVVSLTIAFEATESIIDRLFSWIEANLGKGIILNISYDPKILAGTIIVFEGKYLDLTIKKRIDEVFENRKEEIRRIISN